jgi:poly(ADP-ribose) polymerase-like protein
MFRRCVTKAQIKQVKEITGDNTSKVKGYDLLSAAAKDHLRQAFDAGEIVDKEFKGLPESIVQGCEDCRVEHAKSSRAACQMEGCGEKIAKDELRLGVIMPPPPGTNWHSSWKWIHWYVQVYIASSNNMTLLNMTYRRCLKNADVQFLSAMLNGQVKNLDGLEELDENGKQSVQESFESQTMVHYASEPVSSFLVKGLRDVFNY